MKDDSCERASFNELNSAEFLAELKANSSREQARFVNGLAYSLECYLTNKMGIPPADAEDVAFEALERALTSIESFHYGGPAKLTTWVFRVARNRAVDYHRAKKRERERLNSLTCPPIARTNPKIRNEQLSWLVECLNGLDPKDIQILRWHAERYTFAEIGEWLKMTEGNARIRHKRALDRIRELARGERSLENLL